MKRLIVPSLVLSTLLFLGSSTYAQRGRPSGTPGAAGSMGASGTHGNSASAGGGHSSSNPMASTDPGSVLEHNSHLATKLETLTGTTNLTDLEKDASAFKNFGQFVAAAHVSKNLNIPGCAAFIARVAGLEKSWQVYFTARKPPSSPGRS
jgi:hypothetical protein